MDNQNVQAFGMAQRLKDASQTVYGRHLYRNKDLEADLLHFFKHPYGRAMFHRLPKKVGVSRRMKRKMKKRMQMSQRLRRPFG